MMTHLFFCHLPFSKIEAREKYMVNVSKAYNNSYQEWINFYIIFEQSIEMLFDVSVAHLNEFPFSNSWLYSIMINMLL